MLHHVKGQALPVLLASGDADLQGSCGGLHADTYIRTAGLVLLSMCTQRCPWQLPIRFCCVLHQMEVSLSAVAQVSLIMRE